jgi:MFS family permease
VALAHAVTHMRGSILPLVYPTIMGLLRLTYVDLTLMLTITRLVGGALQSIWGTLVRRFPARTIMGLENLGVALGIALVPAAHNLAELTGVVTLGQVAASPQHPVGSAAITGWYRRARHGTTLAIHSQSGRFATLLSPLIATFLIIRVGWQDTLYLFTVPALLVGVWILFALPPERIGVRLKESPHRTWGRDFLRPLQNPLLRRLIAVRCMSSVGKGIGTLLVFVPLFLRSLHYGQVLIGVLYTAVTAASVVAPLISGPLSDRFSRGRVLETVLAGGALFGALMAFVAAHLAIWAFAPLLVVFGMFCYGYGPVETAIVADITPAELRADSYSLYYALTTTISAVWPVVLGYLIQTWGFDALFLAIATSFLCALLLYRRLGLTAAFDRARAAAGSLPG